MCVEALIDTRTHKEMLRFCCACSGPADIKLYEIQLQAVFYYNIFGYQKLSQASMSWCSDDLAQLLPCLDR